MALTKPTEAAWASLALRCLGPRPISSGSANSGLGRMDAGPAWSMMLTCSSSSTPGLIISAASVPLAKLLPRASSDGGLKDTSRFAGRALGDRVNVGSCPLGRRPLLPLPSAAYSASPWGARMRRRVETEEKRNAGQGRVPSLERSTSSPGGSGAVPAACCCNRGCASRPSHASALLACCTSSSNRNGCSMSKSAQQRLCLPPRPDHRL